MLIKPAGQDTGVAIPDQVIQAHWTNGSHTTALVRPDGYFCWATEKAEHDDALRVAVTTWAGRTTVGKGTHE
ncbi:aromatic-ring hydroxylase C-terminal domain-containing protein [Nonomuraea sp. KM88]|uniref:aromatic-ring hydroxylase C-terminal domain-containing protein n=1 Tax=Nonomuraea sp. KM88 TaxID=3457427 RepID=UPI003FCCE777